MEFLKLLPILLLAVVVHEVAHALVAKWEGDETAYRLGRVTLNPIPHLDPMGSIVVPLVLWLLPGGFIFGWAKPVPVNPANFRNYRAGDIRVSLAGIAANLLLALASVALAVLFVLLEGAVGGVGGARVWVLELLFFSVFINLILAFFNLIPLPPLDGSHVVYHLLPPAAAARYREAGRYGIGILFLVVMVFPQAISFLLAPVGALMSLVYSLVGALG